MQRMIRSMALVACMAIVFTGNASSTPPRQFDLGIRALDEQVNNGPVRLEFYYARGFRQSKEFRLEVKPMGDLVYTGPTEVLMTIRHDTVTTWQFEVVPDQFDTSGIQLVAWFDGGGFHLRTGFYFVPTEDSIIMRRTDPWYAAAHPWPPKQPYAMPTVRIDSSNYMAPTPPPDAGRRPSDSAKTRARMEQQKRDFAPYQLELELHERALLEQSPLTDLDAQHIRVGDTIFTRKKGEQYFYPAEKVSSPSPPLWAIDTRAFLDKMLEEEKSPYHLSVACPDSACIEFLNDIADTVYLVPWSDRYQVTVDKKGLKKLRETEYKVLPGEHINKQP